MKLEYFVRELEQSVTERNAQIEDQAQQLRVLTTQLSQIEQRERKRLAEILHDHIQQLIVAAKMQLEWLSNDIPPEQVIATAKGVADILNEALNATRSLTVELSPPVLHDAGLIGGLNWLAGRMQEKNQFTVHLRLDSNAEPDTEAIRFLLFECARELLFNVVKHAGVREADVILMRTEDDEIHLMIRDRGKGFDSDVFRKKCAEIGNFGLFSIQERLAFIRGRMEIKSVLGSGTEVILVVPGSKGALANQERKKNG